VPDYAAELDGNTVSGLAVGVRHLEAGVSWVPGGLPPDLAPEERAAGRFVASRIVIDACRPYRWLKEFPATNVMSQAKKKQIATKWHGVLDKLGR